MPIAADSLLFCGMYLFYQETVLDKTTLKTCSAPASGFISHVALAWFYNRQVNVAMLHER
jgi:hypothetical protein